VLADMKKNEKTHSPANLKNDEELKAYFEAVIPDYDKEKVYTSHMKKLINWYNILNEKGLVEELTTDEAATEESAEDKNTSAEGGEEKPEIKKAAKGDKADKTAKPKKEVKPRAEKPAKATSKAAGGGARKTVTPRKAS
jgi:hypothetical protein